MHDKKTVAVLVVFSHFKLYGVIEVIKTLRHAYNTCISVHINY